MAKASIAQRIQKSPKKNAKKSLNHINHLTAFIAAFGGAAFGIALMLAFALPMLQGQIKTDLASSNQQPVILRPASLDASDPQCLAPSSNVVVPQSGPTPGVQTASVGTTSTSQPFIGGKGSGAPGTSNNGSSGTNVITRLIAANITKNTATNETTGAGSKNIISQNTTNTTTVENNNDVDITNNNSQTAKSGDVNSTQNTTSGSTPSGQAVNKSNSSFAVTISN